MWQMQRIFIGSEGILIREFSGANEIKNEVCSQANALNHGEANILILSPAGKELEQPFQSLCREYRSSQKKKRYWLVKPSLPA